MSTFERVFFERLSTPHYQRECCVPPEAFHARLNVGDRGGKRLREAIFLEIPKKK
jgi:hypothetical protein